MIDSSALLAILFDEPERERFVHLPTVLIGGAPALDDWRRLMCL